MMIADNKPHPRLMLEHITGEIQHTGKAEGTLYVNVTDYQYSSSNFSPYSFAS